MQYATSETYDQKTQLGFFSIRRGMLLGASSIIAGIIVAGVAMYQIDNTYRIGSDNYSKIAEGKDLIADILPPPLTPYQAMLIIHALDITPADKIPAARDKVAQLHKDFTTRLALWDEVMKQRGKADIPQWKEFFAALHSKGDVFWKVLETEALPAVVSNASSKDEDINKAMTAFYGLESTVESSVYFINNDIAASESLSKSGADRGMNLIIGVFAVILTMIGLLSFLGQKIIVQGITRLSRAMEVLSQGNIEIAIPYEDRKDEIGVMARALAVFKSQSQKIRASDIEKTGTLTIMKQQADAVAANQAENKRVIEEMGEALNRLSAGDLTCKLTTPFAESLDVLRQNYNKTIDALQELISNVKLGAESIMSGTGEIAEASGDLSRRSESQAATLEETAAAVAQITDKVRITASGAVRAREVVQSAKVDADKSGEVVAHAIDAMHRIEESSKKITQIIGMIDEISFQTNLLALNAGVEAARAGDAGRGFAVVAQEVRALAQRSAGAAKEIKVILSSSQDSVEEGVGLVTATGDSLRSIIERVGEINTVISEIAQSAEQQASGLQEVNAAVDNMDKATQQNAAMVEETTAATRMLTEQTVELAKLVSRFSTTASSAISREDSKSPSNTKKTASVRPEKFIPLQRTGTGVAHKLAGDDWSEF
ncbi:methyl-accepting chemotaxis protein [Aestuariivirga litoralis]|uniref:methyl-accepting chemotaxis protein n=1 Tax=Aestuariivirga litoralis TaxID=2650924 RepID=UPI001FEFDB02|nr:HAMP domain-containing methyl-accepting chemotaxis protein [Aestuariivirga litoralis]MBG1232639.1 methyl-accepting chemotaxis protein [Aestuariivirga litoralis]